MCLKQRSWSPTNMPGYKWVRGSLGNVPPNALEGGRDSDGSRIYIGKAFFQGDELPCKVVPQRREAYVSHGGREHKVSTFEVFVEQKLRWVRNSGSYVPPGAVQGGRTSSGETLYIGKARHGGATIVGKVHPSHGCVYIAYGGNEISYKDYEILVMN